MPAGSSGRRSPVSTVSSVSVLYPSDSKKTVTRSLSTLTTREVEKPVEKARLFLLLSFLHAVIQERLRYAPSLGWKGVWEWGCVCGVA